jgi:hypothetical protein
MLEKEIIVFLIDLPSQSFTLFRLHRFELLVQICKVYIRYLCLSELVFGVLVFGLFVFPDLVGFERVASSHAGSVQEHVVIVLVVIEDAVEWG